MSFYRIWSREPCCFRPTYNEIQTNLYYINELFLNWICLFCLTFGIFRICTCLTSQNLEASYLLLVQAEWVKNRQTNHLWIKCFSCSVTTSGDVFYSPSDFSLSLSRRPTCSLVSMVTLNKWWGGPGRLSRVRVVRSLCFLCWLWNADLWLRLLSGLAVSGKPARCQVTVTGHASCLCPVL